MRDRIVKFLIFWWLLCTLGFCTLIILLTAVHVLEIDHLNSQVQVHRAALDSAFKREQDLTQKLQAAVSATCTPLPDFVSSGCATNFGLRVEEGRPLCDAVYSVPRTGRVLMRPGATAVVTPYAKNCKKGK